MNMFKRALLYCIGIVIVLVAVVLLIGYYNACNRNIGVVTTTTTCAAGADYNDEDEDDKSKSPTNGKEGCVDFPLRLNECKRVAAGDVLLVHLNDGTRAVVGGPAQFQVTQFDWRRDNRDGHIHVKLTQGSLLVQLPHTTTSSSFGGEDDDGVRRRPLCNDQYHFHLPSLYAVGQRGRMGFHVSTRLGESMATVLLDHKQCAGRLKLPDKCRSLRFHREVYRTNGRNVCHRPLLGRQDMELWFHQRGGGLVRRLDALVEKAQKAEARRSRKHSYREPGHGHGHQKSPHKHPHQNGVKHNNHNRRNMRNVVNCNYQPPTPQSLKTRKRAPPQPHCSINDNGATSTSSSREVVEDDTTSSVPNAPAPAPAGKPKEVAASRHRTTLADGDVVVLSCGNYGYMSRIMPATAWFSADASRADACSFVVECSSSSGDNNNFIYPDMPFRLRHCATRHLLGVVTEDAGGVAAVALGKGEPLTWRARPAEKSKGGGGGSSSSGSSEQEAALRFMQTLQVQDIDFLTYLSVDSSGIMLTDRPGDVTFQMELVQPAAAVHTGNLKSSSIITNELEI